MTQRLFEGEDSRRFHHGVGTVMQGQNAGLEFFFLQALSRVGGHHHGFDTELAEAFRQQRACGLIQAHKGGAGGGFPREGRGSEVERCGESFIHVEGKTRLSKPL